MMKALMCLMWMLKMKNLKMSSMNWRMKPTMTIWMIWKISIWKLIKRVLMKSNQKKIRMRLSLNQMRVLAKKTISEI